VSGKYGKDKAGYAEMLRASRRFAARVWAVKASRRADAASRSVSGIYDRGRYA
jgi:hypothetical protein